MSENTKMSPEELKQKLLEHLESFKQEIQKDKFEITEFNFSFDAIWDKNQEYKGTKTTISFTQIKQIEKNLELLKQITFDELVEHGLNNGANIVNGMPWSWKINGKTITHENDQCYIIETMDGNERFEKGSDKLIAFESGLRIMTNSIETHAPGGCPM